MSCANDDGGGGVVVVAAADGDRLEYRYCRSWHYHRCGVEDKRLQSITGHRRAT